MMSVRVPMASVFVRMLPKLVFESWRRSCGDCAASRALRSPKLTSGLSRQGKPPIRLKLTPRERHRASVSGSP